MLVVDVIDAYREAVNGINVKRNQDIIIRSSISSDGLLFLFAKKVNGANIEIIQKELIRRKSFYHLLRFSELEKANVQEIADFFLDSKNVFWIKAFYEDVNHDKFDTSKFETYLIFM